MLSKETNNGNESYFYIHSTPERHIQISPMQNHCKREKLDEVMNINKYVAYVSYVAVELCKSKKARGNSIHLKIYLSTANFSFKEFNLSQTIHEVFYAVKLSKHQNMLVT